MKDFVYSIDKVKDKFNDLYGETTFEQVDRYQKLFNKFCNKYKENKCFFASSSGRVEVCGNHTDHNGGKVVSCAISLDTLCCFLPTDYNIIKIDSEGHSPILVDLTQKESEKLGTSSALVRGVCVGIKNRGYKVGGFKAVMTSNVVSGAGISSSASFEVLICEILNFLYNDEKITNEEKSQISQFSENVYFNKPCGLLDQTAIAYGGLNVLDFADKNKISVKPINNELKDFSLVLVCTGGTHENLTNEYASIPAEMKEVAKCFNKERLIEINEEDFYKKLPEIKNKVSDRAIGRAIHFYNENKRVEKLYNALLKNDTTTFLNCIRDSGISSFIKLQNCYIPGSKEQLIPKALNICEKYLENGANRVHGGGFAGTILNIVENNNLDYFVKNISNFYDKKSIIVLKPRKVGTIIL